MKLYYRELIQIASNRIWAINPLCSSLSNQYLFLIVNSLSNETLIWEYYEKLSKHDAIKAVEVFTKRDPSPSFQPLDVAEKLASNRSICMIYLRSCIFDKGSEDEDLHTYLATLYIDSIQDTDSDTELRAQFRQLLISSNSLKVQFLIGRLQKTSLRLELAILHGKVSPSLII